MPRAPGIIKSHRPAHFLETNLALFAVVDVDATSFVRDIYTRGETGKRTAEPMAVCRGRSAVVVTVAKSEYRIGGDRKLRVTRSGRGINRVRPNVISASVIERTEAAD